MTLRGLLRDLANYEFDFERSRVRYLKRDSPPCLAFRVIKEEIANKATHEIATAYTYLNKLYESAVLTKLALDTDCIEVFDTLRELYLACVNILRKHLSSVDFRDEKLNSLVDEILNDYEFNFRNVSNIFNPVCNLHFELRLVIRDSLETPALLSLFDYLCYIQVIVLAYRRVLDIVIDDDEETNADDVETFIAKLRADYNELAMRIRDIAAILAEEVFTR